MPIHSQEAVVSDARRETPDRHVFDHALAQRADGSLCHGGLPSQGRRGQPTRIQRQGGAIERLALHSQTVEKLARGFALDFRRFEFARERPH